MQMTIFGRNMLYGLSNNFTIPYDGISCFSVSQKAIKRHSVYEVRDNTHCHDNMAYECR